MDVYEAITRRRSIRKFLDKEIPWEMTATVINAGKYAPSPGNLQNVKFLAIKNEDKRRAITKACYHQEWMDTAPIYIVVCLEYTKSERFYGMRGSRLYGPQHVGAAIQNMLLAAHDLGLGACWVGAFDEDAVGQIILNPEDVLIQGIVALGYPDETPKEPPKYRLEHVMFVDKWWGRVEFPKNHLGWWSYYNAQKVGEAKKGTKKLVNKIKDHIQKKVAERKKKS